MQQLQGRAVLTLSVAGSPRLWVWGVALQVPGVGYLVKAGGWVCSRRDHLSRVAGGRQSAEAAEANCSPGREEHLNLPCFYGERVVASTELEHGNVVSTQSPI